MSKTNKMSFRIEVKSTKTGLFSVLVFPAGYMADMNTTMYIEGKNFTRGQIGRIIQALTSEDKFKFKWLKESLQQKS